ncbi:hypothetical protein EDD11_005431 [Mortierella claussenii]|nr:hypothetical protein EDD11_005431 [Mortierella claussenii]
MERLPPLPPITNPFESEPTWTSLAEHTSGILQNLMLSADHNYKSYYQIQAAQVVESVRVMLYASGTIDKDAAPIRLYHGLKVHHRQIMAALSRLVLSAKMASSVWPAEGALSKMRADADDVANAVHQFITTAQSAGVTVHDVDAKLILDPEGSLESKDTVKLGRTLSNSSKPLSDASVPISSSRVDKTSYRRSLGSAGVLTQLDYYCKSACKAIALLSLQITKVLDGPQHITSRVSTSMTSSTTSTTSSRPLSGLSIMNSAQSSQLVAQCQQTLSQIGSLLTLVSEFYAKVLAEHPTIKDHIFLDVRVSKQALYNNVAALVMAIQLATDPMAQSTVLEMTLEAVQTAESSVMDLTAAARSLVTENDEAEKHVSTAMYSRIRTISETSSTLLGGSAAGISGSISGHDGNGRATSLASHRRQSELDEYFLDQESDLDGETTKSSRHRSDSRSSSLSSNSSGASAPTTPGTEYTSRSHSVSTYPFAQQTAPVSPMEVMPPTASRPSISMAQKADARGAKLKKMLGEDVPTPKPAKVAEVPWFMGHDYSPSEISFNMEGHVRGGTLPALVERLTVHDGYDANFVATFLLTYRSFCSTSQFFQLLFRRITIAPPPGLNASELTIWTDRKLTPIRLRVFNIIKSWLENFYLEDEEEDRQMLPRIKEFAESGLLRDLMSFAAVQLIKLVEKREQSDSSFRKMVLNLSTQAPQPITPRNLKRIRFLDLDPLELARQLTIMEANVFNKIKPVECLGNAWTSSDPEIVAKVINIKKVVENSNLYISWINEVILNEKDIKKRAMIIRHIIAVGEKLRHLNNFSMLYSITAALALSPVHRLKRTWELVPYRAMTALGALQTVVNSHKNYRDYRQELHSANPPCVPFLGVYLTDLVMIQDGNPDFLKGTDQHINFYKRGSTAEVIREIQQYQSVPYCLTTVQEIQTYIRRGMDHAKPVEDLQALSLSVEPREGEEEKITRLLSESGFL